MPIALIEAPLPNNRISDPIEFEFNMTGIDDGTTLRRFGYQLFDSNDNPITALEAISPKEGENFIIRFNRDIIFNSYNAMACGGSVSTTPVPVKSVYLKYWELLYNRETCETAIENEISTDTFRIINTTLQPFEPQTVYPDFILMQPYPTSLELCRGNCHIVTIWSEDATLKIVVNDDYEVQYNVNDPDQVFTTSVTPSSLAIAWFGTGTSGFDSAAEALKAIRTIKVYIDDVLQTTFRVTDCCDAYQVQYLTSRGGWAHMELIEEQSGVDTSGSLFLNNGLQETDKEAYITKSFTKDVDGFDEFYLQDFIASKSKKIRMNGIWVNFLMDYGNYTVNVKEEFMTMVLRGRINKRMNLPQ